MAKPLDYSKCDSLGDCFVVRYEHCLKYNEHEIIRDDILKQFSTGCKVVKELGVWQGGTLAMFLFQDGVEKVIGIDISFNKYMGSVKKHLDAYAEESGKEVTCIQTSSLSEASVSPCDFLHIDSLHDPKHLMSELKLHADSVSKYIAFHDVNQKNRELFKVVMNFMERVQPGIWRIVIDYDKGKCGCLVIGRNE